MWLNFCFLFSEPFQVLFILMSACIVCLIVSIGVCGGNFLMFFLVLTDCFSMYVIGRHSPCKWEFREWFHMYSDSFPPGKICVCQGSAVVVGWRGGVNADLGTSWSKFRAEVPRATGMQISYGKSVQAWVYLWLLLLLGSSLWREASTRSSVLCRPLLFCFLESSTEVHIGRIGTQSSKAVSMLP